MAKKLIRVVSFPLAFDPLTLITVADAPEFEFVSIP